MLLSKYVSLKSSVWNWNEKGNLIQKEKFNQTGIYTKLLDILVYGLDGLSAGKYLRIIMILENQSGRWLVV